MKNIIFFRKASIAVVLIFLIQIPNHLDARPLSELVPESYLLVKCEVDAKVIVDAVEVGRVSAKKPERFTVLAGEHFIRIESTDGALFWENKFTIPSGEQRILDPTLIPIDQTIGLPSTFKDPRSLITYRTVKIGNHEWFVDNYATPTPGSLPPNRNETNVATFGRLYKISDALALAPYGWRLPSESDFANLLALYPDTYSALVGGKSGLHITFPGNMALGSAEGFGVAASFWTSTQGPKVRGHKTYKMLFVYSVKSEVSISDSYYEGSFYRSVRFVRDLP